MSYTEINDPEPPNPLPLAILIVLIIIMFCLLMGKAFAAPCIGHIERQTDFALFSDLTSAKIFADEHDGKIITSDDDKTFTVIYPVTLVVTNVPDDCGGED